MAPESFLQWMTAMRGLWPVISHALKVWATSLTYSSMFSIRSEQKILPTNGRPASLRSSQSLLIAVLVAACTVTWLPRRMAL